MINPFATTTEIAILEILQKHGEMYGLQIVQASDGKLKRGTVYVTLGRMEERELVRSEVDKYAPHPGLPRPRYFITDAGKRILKAWRAVNQGAKS